MRGRQVKNKPVPTEPRADDSSDEDTADDEDTESVEGDPTDGVFVTQPAASNERPASHAVTTDDDTRPPSAPRPSGDDADHDTSAPVAVPMDVDASPELPVPCTGSPGGSVAPPQCGPQPQASTSSPIAQKLLEQCVKNWKAASSDKSKKMWAMFDESGLFASACRHGFSSCSARTGLVYR